MRQRPPTVAIVGPDGAGKTAVARGLTRVLPIPSRYLYMGWNYDASNVVLPTTRLARRLGLLRAAGSSDPAAPRRRTPLVREAVSVGKLLNLVAEAWYRQIVANRWTADGHLVVFDRHFTADFPASRGGGTGSPLRRIRHAILRRAVRPPDILIYLDAPAELLLHRGREGTIESLERQRIAYRRVVDEHACAAEVPADADLADVIAEVAKTIMALERRPGSHV